MFKKRVGSVLKLFSFFSLIAFFAFMVFALSSVTVNSPSSNQNLTGTINLSATIDNGDGVVTNVTFEFINSTSGTFNFTVFNVSSTVFENASFDSASELADGLYNITVRASNGTDDVTGSVTLITIDNVLPTITFAAPSIANSANVSNISAVAINASIADSTSGINTINITLYNSTNVVQQSNQSTAVSANAASLFVNYTSLNDGRYYVNVTAVDFSGNENSSLRNFTLDTTNPSASLSKTSSTKTSITVSFSCSDFLDSSPSCTLSGSSGSVSGTDEVTGLSCGNSYTITVTAEDSAGNTGSSSESMSTDSCGGGGGGTGSSAPSFWTNTFVDDDVEFSEKGSFTRELAEKHRVRIKFNEEEHHVGVKSLTANSALVEVSSLPQEKSVNLGESWKVDLDNDGYYDLSVTLNSIQDSKASLTLLSVYELIPPEVSSDKETQEDGTSLSPEGELGESTRGAGFVGIFLVILVIVAVVVVFYVLRKRSGQSTKK